MDYIVNKGYTSSVRGIRLPRGTIVNEQSGIAPDLFQQLIDDGVLIEGDTLPQPAPKTKTTRRKSTKRRTNS